MPSLRVLLKGFAFSTLVSSSVAAPVSGGACSPEAISKVPAIPASGASPDLNSTALTLQYVALGRGIQNYTCSAVGKVGAAIGAIATLYDATAVAYSDVALLHALPPLAVRLPVADAGKIETAGENINLSVLGDHYFDSTGTPVFHLSAHSKILFAAKVESVPAPAGADKGPLGTGAVTWLKLNKKTGSPSVGLGSVYRVETAGGNSPLCTAASGVISAQYAAEYWFYA